MSATAPPRPARRLLSYGGPDPVVAVAETELRPTVLSLVASGRMRLDGGTIAIDDDGSAPETDADPKDAAARVAERVALVDTPRINEPADDVSLRAVVAEEPRPRRAPLRPARGRRHPRRSGPRRPRARPLLRGSSRRPDPPAHDARRQPRGRRGRRRHLARAARRRGRRVDARPPRPRPRRHRRPRRHERGRRRGDRRAARRRPDRRPRLPHPSIDGTQTR
ncbi:hypothetical protein [Clavibacter tessellarius]|uniref:hypothetical protein n=1 Tax=Clavibacter tessellarius TaxID=31965 RepID=UPI0032550B2A